MERVRNLKFLWLAIFGGVGALLIWDEFFAPDVPQPPANISQAPVYGPGPVNPPEVLSGDLTPVDLPIENIAQQTQVWCWAAVSQQLIAASRGMANTPSQCQLVASAYGADPGPCCAGQDPRCVTTGSLQQIQALIQQYGGRTSTYAAPTDAMTLYRTLKMGHAVVIGIEAGQGMGHVVVARGMSFQQTPQGVVAMVHINDPMAHFTQPVPYSQVAAVWRQAIIVN
ncbi:hypothetical protein ABI_09470 [Asticcacaulis biprosthecium C19]|uniref:Peptidase C39-like domain-containing protein n=2 Tax=Asticcacaulis biprosthecium TaxID=76891 RepID=F4QGQ8_9CAUL|nr:hypothetical protein ABI_09470 [Asticcacaulis biprosthecium C19]